MITIDREDPNRLLALGMRMALGASGKSRLEVAELAGVSATHITKLVSGQVNPSQKVLSEFALALDCPLSEIYRLGEMAMDRDRESRIQEDLSRAASERHVEALVQAASWLNAENLDELIEALHQLKAKQLGELVA